MRWYVSQLGGQRQALGDVLVLHYPNPNGCLTICRAQPYVILLTHANLDRKMRSQALGIRVLTIKPTLQFVKRCSRLGERYAPFSGVLGEKTVDVENFMRHVQEGCGGICLRGDKGASVEVEGRNKATNEEEELDQVVAH